MTPGSALAAMRLQETKVCPVCGNSFTGLRTRKTCSNRCKQVVKNRKKKAP